MPSDAAIVVFLSYLVLPALEGRTGRLVKALCSSCCGLVVFLSCLVLAEKGAWAGYLLARVNHVACAHCHALVLGMLAMLAGTSMALHPVCTSPAWPKERWSARYPGSAWPCHSCQPPRPPATTALPWKAAIQSSSPQMPQWYRAVAPRQAQP